MTNDKLGSLPGKLGENVKALQDLLTSAEGSGDAVGIDKAAQSLYDMVKGSYPEHVEKFILPTIDVLQSMGLANVIDWDSGDALANKVQSYLVLAEDFGLSSENVEDIEALCEGWFQMKPKKDKVHTVKESVSTPDMPFALRVTYKGEGWKGNEFGTRAGECYWANLKSKVKSDHFKTIPGHEDGKFSPEIQEAFKVGREALLNGAESVQVWDYEISKVRD